MNLPRWDSDRERRALRPPVDLRERLRLALKVPAPFLAYVWVREQSPQTGAHLLVAFAGSLLVISLVELVWLRTSPPSERIFTRTRMQAFVLHVAAVAASAAALAYAVPRLP